MSSRLFWNATSDCGWQAVDLNRMYEITLARETGHQLYSLEVAEGDKFPEYVGDYKTLDQAQRAAQRVSHTRATAVDPLAIALARFHPERAPA